MLFTSKTERFSFKSGCHTGGELFKRRLIHSVTVAIVTVAIVTVALNNFVALLKSMYCSVKPVKKQN